MTTEAWALEALGRINQIDDAVRFRRAMAHWRAELSRRLGLSGRWPTLGKRGPRLKAESAYRAGSSWRAGRLAKRHLATLRKRRQRSKGR